MGPRPVVGMLGTLLLSPALAHGQTESGRIVGTVRDPSGAVVNGAAVVVVSVERSAARRTTTDDGGQYIFAGLVPGSYEITSSVPSFAAAKARTLVPVGATVEVDLTLALATRTDAVAVIAETVVGVNTKTQDVATTVTGAQIAELPLITRNPYDLVGLSGNVVPDDASARGTGFAINGQRSASTNVLLDGGANNDEFQAVVGQDVPLDAVREFSVVTSTFSAQFGRASGGVVNVATKSGTNDFHGSVYGFLRNQGLATRTFDEKSHGRGEASFERNAAGVSLGGPLIEDRLHYFVNAEYLRIHSAAPQRAYVPTPELLARAAASTRAFFAAFPLRPDLRIGEVLTAGEILGATPGGAFSELPASLPAFQEVSWDVPGDAGGGMPGDDFRLVARLDWALGARATAFARYAWQDVALPDGSVSKSPYRGFDTPTQRQNHNLIGSLTYVFSPRGTSQTKVAYNRLLLNQPLGEWPHTPTLYLRGSLDPGGRILPACPGYFPLDDGALPLGGPQQLLQLYEEINIVSGRHDVRIGGSFVHIRDDRTFGAGGNAVELLGNTTGQSLDNLMAGYLHTFTVAVDPQGRYPGDVVSLPLGEPAFTRDNRYDEWALYLNDSWAITPRIKLSLGLRYERYGVQKNADASLDSNFYYGAGASRAEQIRGGRVWTAPDGPVGGLWRPDRDDFAPRVGFAWDFTGDGKSSLRAGYGIGYERNFGNVTYNVIQNPPRYAVVSLRSGLEIPQALNPVTTDNRGPLGGRGAVQLPPTSLRHVDEDLRTAYAHFWSASLQRQVSSDHVLELTYSGSRGEKLYSIADTNRPGTGPVYLGDPAGLARLNAQYTSINTRGNGGYSRYHGLTLGWEARRLGGRGLQATARYTLGFTRDNLSSTFGESRNQYNLGFLDAFDSELDYGWADHDVRHRFVMSGIWQLPFGANGSRLRRGLLGDWSFNWLLTAQSGAPFTVYDCTNAYSVCMRLLSTAPRKAYTATPTGSPNSFVYLDFSNQAAGFGAYVNPLTGTSDFGPFPQSMEARNTYRQPGRWNADAVLARRLRFGGRVSLHLRFEVYNVFNHANLYIVPYYADTTNARPEIVAFRGYVPGVGGMPGDGQRRIQLGAKLEF